MPAIRNSKTARTSRPPAREKTGAWWDTPLAMLLVALISAGAVWYVYERGFTLYYGDAAAHLNIARRIVDSRTPGPNQLGTPWLPLPHLLMIPFVRDNRLWQTGLAGAIPMAACFVIAATFLFATARSVFASRAAGATAAALLALNPNLLYLQSTPMTEPVFLACLMAVLYFTVRFARTQSMWAVVCAGLAACAGTLARYEGWFLIPFVSLYFLVAAKQRRFAAAIAFSALATLGPIAWLAHNAYYSGDALAFYRGEGSARAVQGAAYYPGKDNWELAWLQFRTVVRLCLGPALCWMGLVGGLAALLKRAVWPLVLLALPPVFYVWSLHSAGNPIFVPSLWPHSYYNTRYGLAMLPLAAFAAAALVAWTPPRLRAVAATIVILASCAPWLLDPHPDAVITWKESQVNSVARRAWTNEAAEFLRSRYRPGTGVFTTFGDITGIFQRAGIPLHDTLTWDNWPHWQATVARPDLFLWEEWAVAQGGDPVQSAINRAFLRGPRYTLQETVMVPNAPVIEIYRRDRRRGLDPEPK
jgi:Dolichyl-phosphate-mannose-protein mannosyltransferase